MDRNVGFLKSGQKGLSRLITPEEVAVRIQEHRALPAEKQKSPDRLLITIDGPCASGKTTLAARLAEIFSAAVIHTDDFVIPHAQKTAERLAVPGGNCDAGRLLKEVVNPWKNGISAVFRRYDCRADRMLEPEELPASDVLILEGSYSNLPEIRKQADLRIFMDIPWEIRERRLRRRESAESLKRFQERWIPLENAYFEAFGLPDEDCILVSAEESF